MCCLIKCGFLYTLRVVPSWSAITTSPWSGLRNPTNRLSSVVFPAPLIPIRPKISPLLISKSIFERTWWSSKFFESPCALNIVPFSSFLKLFSRYVVTCDSGQPAFRRNCLISIRERPFSALIRMCSSSTSSMCVSNTGVFKNKRHYFVVVKAKCFYSALAVGFA